MSCEPPVCWTAHARHAIASTLSPASSTVAPAKPGSQQVAVGPEIGLAGAYPAVKSVRNIASGVFAFILIAASNPPAWAWLAGSFRFPP